jgi:hypothetical protein
MKQLRRLFAVMVSLLAVSAWADLSATPKVAQTQAALRDLWVGHVFWVRNVAVATMAGNKEAAAVAEGEVVADAKAIAAAIEPFYGKEASDKLFNLLAGHWGAVKAHILATQKGDAKAQDAAMKTLIANADEIATFLSGANPNLPKDTLKGLLIAHGGHHAAQNAAIKAKKWADEAKTWEAMKGHMYVIADALGDGIAKQFPDKFK